MRNVALIPVRKPEQPMSFVPAQNIYQWAARFSSLHLELQVPPMLKQFWGGGVLSPAPKEISELLSHERKPGPSASYLRKS